MGCFDTVITKCPSCGETIEFQSKGGSCDLCVYDLDNATDDVLSDVNRHSPIRCECGKFYEIEFETKEDITKAKLKESPHSTKQQGKTIK